MSTRVCSTCKRRIRWWQLRTPKDGQCFQCFITLPVDPDLYDYAKRSTTREDYADRVVELARRGLREEIVWRLWTSGNEEQLAKLEKATDLEIGALNLVWDEEPRVEPEPLLPKSVEMTGPVTINLWDLPDGLQKIELHPIKEAHVTPKVGEQVTVTFAVTRVDWVRTEGS